MYMESADDLVAFQHVRVVRATASALFCAIGDKRVWLPRAHIKGNLWRRGDCGTLLVRRWVAIDRHLNAQQTTERLPILVGPPYLHLLRSGCEVPRGH